MEGGVFGLSLQQKGYLYASQLVPTVITLLFPDLLSILLYTQIFYPAAIFLYIRFLSL